MTRDVHLIKYLPEFMQEYKEMQATLDAEDPEFVLVWDAADRTLNNEFILTADSYGISRYESLLGINPYDTDTLEDRRSRVMERWFEQLPYTIRRLMERIEAICGDEDFYVYYDFENGYTFTIIVQLENYWQTEDLNKVLETWMPANINYDTSGVGLYTITNDAPVGAGTVLTEIFTLTNDSEEEYVVDGTANMGTTTAVMEKIVISD